MKNHLKDKVVLITGASKGIGFADAELFLKQGAKVAFCDLIGAEVGKAKKSWETTARFLGKQWISAMKKRFEGFKKRCCLVMEE